MMGNPYGSTGYAANPDVNIQDFIFNIVQSILNNWLSRGTCTQEVAAEIFNIITSNIYNLAQDISNRFVQGDYCDSTQVQEYLARNVLPSIQREVQNRFMASRGGFNNYNQPMFAGNGYGNYQNNSWNRPQYNNYFPQNNGFGYNNQQPSMTSSGSVSSAHGFGKAIVNQNGGISPQQVQNQTQFANSVLNDPSINNNPFLPTSKNTYNEPIKVSTIMDDPLTNKFSAIFKERQTRRDKKISIDKITTNTDTITHNRNMVSNNTCDRDVVIIDKDTNNLDVKNIKVVETIEPDSPEYCDINQVIDITYNGEVISSTNYDLAVPVVNAQEAVDLVKEAAPKFTDHEQWLANIQYRELVVKKIPGFGSEAKDAFRALNGSIDQINDLQDISNRIIPIIKRQVTEVREYLEAIILDRINDLFKTTLYHPEKPMMYPAIKSLSGIFQITDESKKESNEYLSYMFARFGNEYVNNVYLCVKSALIDLFEDDADGTDIVVDTENNGCALLAKLPEITCIAGKYRLCDYGYAPVSHMESLTKQFNRDYLVHKFKQMVFATNIDIDKALGVTATNTVVEISNALPQHVLHTFIGGLKKNGINRDVLLLEMDKTGSFVNKIFRINLGVNGMLFITRE